jgi:hypothetical protein
VVGSYSASQTGLNLSVMGDRAEASGRAEGVGFEPIGHVAATMVFKNIGGLRSATAATCLVGNRDCSLSKIIPRISRAALLHSSVPRQVGLPRPAPIGLDLGVGHRV